MNKPKKVNKLCYILSYRAPNYVRTEVLLNALKGIDGITVHEAINLSTGLYRYIQTLLRLLLIRFTRDPDLYLLGFRGYEIFPIVRLLTAGKTLVFDHMMSPYDSLLNERKTIKKDSFLDGLIFLYEKLILRFSDIILTDTLEHKIFFQELFGLNPQKIHAIPIGADERVFRREGQAATDSKRNKRFEVFFYGTFLPLHGVEVILRAAHLLKEQPISFVIVGGKGTITEPFDSMIRDLSLINVTHKEWVEYEQLPRMIADTDVCLGGPFGNTGQANRVITGKTFQFLAMGKPTIIGRISRDYGFADRTNCLLVEQGNEKELAEAILWCYENRDKLSEIGENGYKLYHDNFSTNTIRNIIQEQILC